jgi:hypothetical protein
VSNSKAEGIADFKHEHPASAIKHKDALARAIVESLHNSFGQRDLRVNGLELLVDDFYPAGMDDDHSGKSVAAPARSIVDKTGFFNQIGTCGFDRWRTTRELRPLSSPLLSTVLAKNFGLTRCSAGNARSRPVANGVPALAPRYFEELGSSSRTGAAKCQSFLT